ncbi:MAG: hypothetical protein U0Q16_39730 [Bryobacteraceae bacterium]
MKLSHRTVPASNRWRAIPELVRKTAGLREGEPARVLFTIPVDDRVQPEGRR